MAGWGRGRALVLAFLAVVALAVVLGRPAGGGAVGGVDGRSGVYAAEPAIGPANATLRAPDEAFPRRWPDGRAGRHPVAWLFAVLVAASAATAGARRLALGGRLGRPVTRTGLRTLAPRAPPLLVQPL